MKKSFWGYQAKEVDEAIDALTKQNTSLIQRNDHLEDELKNMHVQLEEMKANIAHSMTQAQYDEYQELKSAYAALQSRVQDETADSEKVKELEEKLQDAQRETEDAKRREEAAAQEISALQIRMDELQNQAAEIPDDTELKEARLALDGARQELAGKDEQLVQKDALLAGKDAELRRKDEQLAEKEAMLAEKESELTRFKEQPAFVRQREIGLVEINEMMKRVGDAIYETKTNTYRNMMGAVDDFTRQWEESNGQLEEILKDFDAEKDKTRQELLDTVQMILHQFDRMSLKSETMHANLQKLTARRAELREKLELTVEQLKNEPSGKTEKKEERPVFQEEQQAAPDAGASETNSFDRPYDVISHKDETDIWGK